jgi:hypothetical protein
MTNEETTPPSPSPLYEAEVESLDELFSRIDKKLVLNLPEEITDFDINQVVKYYREQRIRFVKDQANFIKPGSGPKSKSSSIEKLKESLKGLKIEF